jgi:hypothetical protein
MLRGLALAKLLVEAMLTLRQSSRSDVRWKRARLLNREDLVEDLGQNTGASKKLFEAIIGVDDTLPRRFLTLGRSPHGLSDAS